MSDNIQPWTCSDCRTVTDLDHSFDDCVQELVKQRAALESQLAAAQKELKEAHSQQTRSPEDHDYYCRIRFSNYPGYECNCRKATIAAHVQTIRERDAEMAEDKVEYDILLRDYGEMVEKREHVRRDYESQVALVREREAKIALLDKALDTGVQESQAHLSHIKRLKSELREREEQLAEVQGRYQMSLSDFAELSHEHEAVREQLAKMREALKAIETVSSESPVTALSKARTIATAALAKSTAEKEEM